MALLSHIYTDITTLSSTPAIVFFKASRRADAAQVLIKLFRAQDDLDSSTRIKTIVSFTELLAVTSVVLGTVSAVRETESGFLIEYVLPPHLTIQSLSEYLLVKRSLATRESERRVGSLRPPSKLNSRSSSNCSGEYSVSTSGVSDLLGVTGWNATPRLDRRASRPRSNRSQSKTAKVTKAAADWKSIAMSIDRWQERIAWQLLAELARGLMDFYKAPDSLRAGITPNIYPEAIFIITNSCASSGLDLTVLACILEPPTHSNSIYTAPELFRGVAKAPTADVWALGCLAFEVVAQRKPRFDPAKLVTDPVLQNIDCSSELLELIASCCRFNPHKRPSLADLMKSRTVCAILTCVFAMSHTKSELTLVNHLDLSRINVRRISESRGFRPTRSEVPVSFKNQSESSDSLSITDILDMRASSASTTMHRLPLIYYDTVTRVSVLGQQSVTWDYDVLHLSSEMNDYISRRRFLSFLLLPGATDLISREALNIVPFLTSFEAIKQLCDLSFDGIALELETGFGPQEETQLLDSLDSAWASILNIPEISILLLKNDYFVERVTAEVSACASWVIDKNNPIAEIKTQLYYIYIILSTLYFNIPQEFCTCFLVNNEHFIHLLSLVFDTSISKLIGSVLAEGHAPPFIIAEAHQFLNYNILQLTSRMDDPGMFAGHVLLLVNLSRELLSAITKHARPAIESSDLIPILSAIKSLLPKGIPVQLLIRHLTTHLLSLLSLCMLQELNAGTYSLTSPAGTVLAKLFSCLSTCFEELPKAVYIECDSTISKDTLSLVMTLNMVCQAFMLYTQIQRRHLKDIGIDAYLDIFAQHYALTSSSLISNRTQESVIPNGAADYVSQTAYAGLEVPDSWSQARNSFAEALTLLGKQFIGLARELAPYLAQLTLNKRLSSVTAVQFSLCRLRNICLDLELQVSLPLGQILTDSLFFSKIQYYLIAVAARKNGGKSLNATAFRREHPEVVYLLATTKRLLHLSQGKRDSDVVNDYITNNLQGELHKYLEDCRQDMLSTVPKQHSVDFDLAKTFIQVLS